MSSRPSRLVAVALALGATLALAACGDDAGFTPDVPPLDASDDGVEHDITWQADAVVVDPEVVRSTILDVDGAAGRFVFDGTAEAVRALAPGDPLVLGGVGIFRVRSVVEIGGELVLETDPATLGDVIAEADISWRESFVGAPHDDKHGAGIGEDEVGVVRAPLMGSYVDGALSFSEEVDGFATSLTLTPRADGYAVAMSSKYESGESVVNLVGSGTLYGFRNEGSLTVRGGSVTDLDVFVDRVRGDFLLEAGAARIQGARKIDIPARVVVPVFVGPIPFRVTLGGGLEVEVSTRVESSSIVSARFRFQGSGGVRLGHGGLEGYGGLDEQSLTFEDADAVTTANIGLGVLMTFPDVGVGVGILGTGGDVFFRMKQEIVSNLTAKVESAGGFPVVTDSCLRVGVNFGAYYGGSFAVFGLTLAEEEVPLYTQINPTVERGDYCDEL